MMDLCLLAGVAAWRRGAGAPQACDACRRSLFSTHWSCPSCGFQLCSTCCRTQREQTSPGTPKGTTNGAVLPAGVSCSHWGGQMRPWL